MAQGSWQLLAESSPPNPGRQLMLGAAPYTLQYDSFKSGPSELTCRDGDSLTLSRSYRDESGSTAQTQ